MRSAPDIAFDYRPSAAMRGAVAAITLVAVACIAVAGMPAALRAGLVAVAILGWATWRPASGPLHVAWDGDGDWSVAPGGRTALPAHLVGHGGLAGVIVLRLRWGGRTRVLLLTRADLPADARRHLRIRLRGQ